MKAIQIIVASLILFGQIAEAQTSVSGGAKEITDLLKGAQNAAREATSRGSNSNKRNETASKVNQPQTTTQNRVESIEVNPVEVKTSAAETRPEPTNKIPKLKKANTEQVELTTLEPTVASDLGLVREELWDGNPVKLSIPVSTEQKIFMPEPGHFGLPKNSNLPIKTRTYANVITITALAEFGSTRIIYLGEQTNTSYIIDVSATKTKARPQVLRIRANVNQITQERARQQKSKVTPPRVGPPGTTNRRRGLATEVDIFKMMSRFAAQQHYAPRRVLKNEHGLKEVKVNRAPLPLFRSNRNLTATPHSGWKYQRGRSRYYVTSVYVVNKGKTAVQLTPRIIRNPIGREGFMFSAVTFQNSVVTKKKGRPGGNATMMYVISKEPLNDIMNNFTQTAKR